MFQQWAAWGAQNTQPYKTTMMVCAEPQTEHTQMAWCHQRWLGSSTKTDTIQPKAQIRDASKPKSVYHHCWKYKKKAEVINNINTGRIQLSCSRFMILMLCTLPRCHTVMTHWDTSWCVLHAVLIYVHQKVKSEAIVFSPSCDEKCLLKC